MLFLANWPCNMPNILSTLNGHVDINILRFDSLKIINNEVNEQLRIQNNIPNACSWMV